MNKNKHMTLDDRTTIQTELDKGTSFKEIGIILGKDCTTISKEVRKHICRQKTGAMGKSFNDCLLNVKHECTLRSVCPRCTSVTNRLCWSCGRCTDTCISYIPYSCPKLKKAPYVCNACKERSKCTLEKSFYRAVQAHNECVRLRSESRSGFAISEQELSHLDSIVSPLLRNGNHFIISPFITQMKPCFQNEPYIPMSTMVYSPPGTLICPEPSGCVREKGKRKLSR